MHYSFPFLRSFPLCFRFIPFYFHLCVILWFNKAHRTFHSIHHCFNNFFFFSIIISMLCSTSAFATKLFDRFSMENLQFSYRSLFLFCYSKYVLYFHLFQQQQQQHKNKFTIATFQIMSEKN